MYGHLTIFSHPPIVLQILPFHVAHDAPGEHQVHPAGDASHIIVRLEVERKN